MGREQMVTKERAQETPPLEPETGFVPEPMTIAETGLDIGLLADLALKALYYEGTTTAGQLGSLLALSQPVMQEVMEFLNRGKLCEVLGSEGHGPTSYRYSLTGSGVARAAAAFERNMYVGPAPVPIADYVNQVRQQSISHVRFDPPAVEEALAKLVLSPETRKRIGKAVASRRSTLIYGASGNGKSTVARRLGEALSGCVLIPHAIDVYGHIVRLFDPSKHQQAQDADRPSPAPRRRDRRWRPAARPAVVAGGELTHYSLELVFNDQSKVYEAPLQMKANGGILIIDDLGRQQMSAVALLNRWIVALEGGVDHLTLHTGQTIEVPFDVIPIFSTNLNPEDLADEAFLRRIRYKVEIPNPTEDEFRAIFDRVGREYGLYIEGPVVDHLLTRWYRSVNRELRGCHPRDLVEAVVDAAGYEGSRAAFTHETLDEACRTYFLGAVDEKSGRQAGKP
jgi:predicted ATPase with chaperone activity